MSERTKEQKRRGAFAYRGNASVIEASVGPVAWVKSPNRVLEQHRGSNRARKLRNDLRNERPPGRTR